MGVRRIFCVVVAAALTVSLSSGVGAAGAGVTYNRGPLMAAANVHLVVWTPRAHGGPRRIASTVAVLRRFLGSLNRSPYYRIVLEYARAPGFGPVVEGPIRADARFAGEFVDRRPYPSPATSAHPLGMRAIRSEIVRAMNARRWEASLHDLYVVLLSPEARTCAEYNGRCATFGRGSRPLLACATHQYFVPEDQPTVYLYLPIVSGQPGCLPDRSSVFRRSPNRKAAAELDALARGIFNTVTDPVGTGWYSGSPVREVGDLCPGLRSVRLAPGRTFTLPRIWSRDRGRCASGAS